MDTKARCTGSSAERRNFAPSNESSRGRLGQSSFNHRRRSRHTGFQAEFAECIDGVRPEGKPRSDLANTRGPLEDQGFKTDPAQGHGSREPTDSCTDHYGSHVIKSKSKFAPCWLRHSRSRTYDSMARALRIGP